MAFARDTYTASAAQTDFTISFGYLAEVDVVVKKNGVTMTNQVDSDTVSYSIVSGVTVQFGAGLTSGDLVVITRSTSRAARLVDYANASTLTEEDMDDDSLQAFYMAEEALDAAGAVLGTSIALEADRASVAGDIMYHDGTGWVALAKGTASQTLKMNSGATAPEWVTV